MPYYFGGFVEETGDETIAGAVDIATLLVDLLRLTTDGSSSAPALTWDGDTDLGLWRIGANGAGFAGNLAFRGPRPWADVRAYGAVGDGVTDDTSAIQAAIDAVISTGALTSTRLALAVLFLPPGVYKITAPLNIRSVIGFHMVGAGMALTELRGSGTIDSILALDGVAYSSFGNFSLDAQGATSIDKMLSLQWSGSGTIGRSTTQNKFYNIRCANGPFRSGFAIGTASGALQVDNNAFYNCSVQGAFVKGSGNTTTYQYGWEIGSGTHGNILNTTLYNAVATFCRRGVAALATNVSVFGAYPGDNEADFYNTGSSPMSIRGGRGENSYRLYEDVGTTAATPVHIADFDWTANAIHSDGFWIKANKAGTLRLTDIRCRNVAPGITAKVSFQPVGNVKGTLIVDGLIQPTPYATAFNTILSNTRVSVRGYIEMDNAATTVTDTYMPLYRSASGVVKVDDTLHAGATLEVDGPLDHDGSTVGFYGVAPASRPAAVTQTYSTADRTLGAYTPDAESTAYTGIDSLQAGSVYARVSDVNALRTAYENLRAFTEDAVQLLNAVVDDLQANGLEQ